MTGVGAVVRTVAAKSLAPNLILASQRVGSSQGLLGEQCQGDLVGSSLRRVLILS